MQHSSTGRRLGRWRPFLCLWPVRWPSSSLAPPIILRFGSFCEPQCTNVISSSSSWTVKEWKRFAFEGAWVPLVLFCVRNSYIVHWTLRVSVNISLHNNWTSEWLGELKRQMIGFVWLMCVMYFLWLKLLYKTELLCPSTKSDIYVVYSCYSDPDVFCFTWGNIIGLSV